jgi:hypothetical protein
MLPVNALHHLHTVAGSGASLTVDATAGGVQFAAAAIPTAAKYVRFQVQGQSVRMTTDGTAPVATTTGFLLTAGLPFYEISRQQALAAKFIREGGSSGVIRSEALTY